VEKLPSGGVNKPVWLWWSGADATAADVDRCRQSFLRRFDVEHTFRLFKQTLGWTKPRLRSPGAADRWTWLVIAAHTQLRLARPLAVDLRRPWEKKAEPNKLTPARVRRGFRNLHAKRPLPRACTETHHSRSRPPARLQEPPTGATPRRGTRPGHRRGTHPPRPPQEGHQAPPNAIDEQPNARCCHDAPHGS
jgi:hypothetical protein